MEGFSCVAARDFEERTFRALNEETMLITVAEAGRHNSMTASWGGFGVLWSRPVAYVFIRPQRYTHELADRSDRFALSFFGEGSYRRELASIYGKLRGSEVDKDEMSGLTPIALPSGAVAYKEARLVFECRKLYAQDLREDCFTDKAAMESAYPGRDFHTAYVLEIENIWVKNA